jgi:hypothetical protein
MIEEAGVTRRSTKPVYILGKIFLCSSVKRDNFEIGFRHAAAHRPAASIERYAA